MAASVSLIDQKNWAVTTAGMFALLAVKATIGLAVFVGALRLLAPEVYRALLGWSKLRPGGKTHT